MCVCKYKHEEGEENMLYKKNILSSFSLHSEKKWEFKDLLKMHCENNAAFLI